MSEKNEKRCPPHLWKVRFNGSFGSESFGELFAYCYYGNCPAKLSRAEIERRLVAGEHIAKLEADLSDCQAEIVAWEARAAVFVDQGELVERLKAVLLTIRDEVIGESAGKTWACRYVEEINKLLGE
jgi:hypothetical protein